MSLAKIVTPDVSVMELIYNGNGEESQNKQKKENWNPNKSINHVEFYFSLNGYKCNLHFWHALHEFPFFCTPV